VNSDKKNSKYQNHEKESHNLSKNEIQKKIQKQKCAKMIKLENKYNKMKLIND